MIELRLRVDGDTIEGARFSGKGCSISQASASMMTGRIEGRSIEDACALGDKFTELLMGDTELLGDADLGDLRALAGVSKFPVRVKCALLGWNCLDELVGESAGSGPPPEAT